MRLNATPIAPTRRIKSPVNAVLPTPGTFSFAARIPKANLRSILPADTTGVSQFRWKTVTRSCWNNPLETWAMFSGKRPVAPRNWTIPSSYEEWE